MLKIEFKECCRKCGHVSVKHSTYQGRSIQKNEAVTIARVSCEHAPVCKAYLESDTPWQGSQT